MLDSRTNRKFREKRRNSRILLGALLLISVTLYFITLGNDDAFRKTRDNAEGFGARALTYMTLPVRGFENFWGEIRGRMNAHADNNSLRKEIHRLSDIEAHANKLEIELSRLQAILNVEGSANLRDQRVAARTVSEVNGPFAKTALINVGANQGISEGDAVMTADGLYGHVIRAGNNSSRVLKLEDLNSRIAVMSKASQARAILIGDNSQYPILSYIASESDWKEGDQILTSGDDGILPAGLPIGRLLSVANGERKVEIFVNNSFVDWVWVYPFDRVTKPENDPVPVSPEASEPAFEAEPLENPETSTESQNAPLEETVVAEGDPL